MADIELVIKIPEEMYKWVNDVNKFFNDYGIGDFIDLIKNGTPLDKIRAEIAILDDADYDYEGYYKAVTDAVKIIDKYKAESEDKE